MTEDPEGCRGVCEVDENCTVRTPPHFWSYFFKCETINLPRQARDKDFVKKLRGDGVCLQGYTWRVTASAGKQHQLPSGDWADVQRGAGEDTMRNTPMIILLFPTLVPTQV